MTRKELINLLFEEHNETTVKLLCIDPELLRDLYVLNYYDEQLRLNKAKKIRAYKQRSRDAVLDRFNIGVNHFYDIQKRVQMIIAIILPQRR